MRSCIIRSSYLYKIINKTKEGFLPVLSKSSFIPSVSYKMATNSKDASSIYEFNALDIDGNEVSLDKYRGRTLLITNLASKWGLTDLNYKQLKVLHDDLSDKGLSILGFPCNQFGNQEPGSNEDVKKFVQEKYECKIDLFSKIDVNGNKSHPLWSFLKSKQGGTLGNFIKWNFTKFIVDKNGIPVKRYSPKTSPFDLRKDLESFL